MLGEMTSLEVSEWHAYFSLKEKYAAKADDIQQKAEDAKRRAKDNNF